MAITGGSRGISDIPTVLRVLAGCIRDAGCEPFVVPAMGSHGGGTADGQLEVLQTYGMTSDALGCPIRSSMDTVEVATSTFGFPLLVDRCAAEADHVVVVNRVKPHTMFSGSVESGIAKMLTIGLGKHDGALVYHRAIVEHGWDAVIADAVPRVVDAASVLGGIAIVERSDERTAAIAPIAGDRILADEPALLARARSWMPRIPFAEVDLALVDRIGKDISGAGLDVNVIGRKGSLHAHHDDPAASTRIRHVAVRGLTTATRGNAIGVGLAELCRTRVLEQTDRATTRINALTAGDLPAAMTPIDFASDVEMVDASLALAGLRGPDQARVVWIRDTLHLDHLVASAALLAEASADPDLEVDAALGPLPFDEDGNLPDDLPD